MAILKNKSVQDAFDFFRKAGQRKYLNYLFGKTFGDVPLKDKSSDNKFIPGLENKTDTTKAKGTDKQDIDGKYIPTSGGQFETKPEFEADEIIQDELQNKEQQQTQQQETQMPLQQNQGKFIPGYEDFFPDEQNKKLGQEYLGFLNDLAKFDPEVGAGFKELADANYKLNYKQPVKMPTFDDKNVYRNKDGSAFKYVYDIGSGQFVKQTLADPKTGAIDYNEIKPEFEMPFGREKFDWQKTQADQENKLAQDKFDWDKYIDQAKLDMAAARLKSDGTDGDISGKWNTSGLVITDKEGNPIKVGTRTVTKYDQEGNPYQESLLVDENSGLALNSILDEAKGLFAKSKYTRSANKFALDLQGFNVYDKKTYKETTKKKLGEQIMKYEYLKENMPEFYNKYLYNKDDKSGMLQDNMKTLRQRLQELED